MRAEAGAPAGRATGPERAIQVRHGAGGAARQRARDMARQVAHVLEREPREGYVGAALLVTAAPVLVLLLARRGMVADQGWLCQETGAALAAGALLFGAARLRAWRR